MTLALCACPHSAGNAPTLLSIEDMRRLMPLCLNVSLEAHRDPEANREWGWIQVRHGLL